MSLPNVETSDPHRIGNGDEHLVSLVGRSHSPQGCAIGREVDVRWSVTADGMQTEVQIGKGAIGFDRLANQGVDRSSV